MKCLLVYDIPNDRTRTKVADFCLDYGLDRIQYSAFQGDLTRTHQEELLLKIKKRMGKQPGNVQLFPICDKDWQQRLVYVKEQKRVGQTFSRLRIGYVSGTKNVTDLQVGYV